MTIAELNFKTEKTPPSGVLQKEVLLLFYIVQLQPSRKSKIKTAVGLNDGGFGIEIAVLSVVRFVP